MVQKPGGRYAWNCHRDRSSEVEYWDKQLGDFYGTTPAEAGDILEAYEQSGEIAPKLLRRFGITGREPADFVAGDVYESVGESL